MLPIHITIQKPIHGTYVSIDGRKLDKAIKNKVPLEICIAGMGCGLHDPKKWKKEAKFVEEKVVYYPDNPMKLFYLSIILAITAFFSILYGLAMDDLRHEVETDNYALRQESKKLKEYKEDCNFLLSESIKERRECNEQTEIFETYLNTVDWLEFQEMITATATDQ